MTQSHFCRTLTTSAYSCSWCHYCGFLILFILFRCAVNSVCYATQVADGSSGYQLSSHTARPGSQFLGPWEVPEPSAFSYSLPLKSLLQFLLRAEPPLAVSNQAVKRVDCFPSLLSCCLLPFPVIAPLNLLTCFLK